jgi:hypothetical protein
MSARFQPTFYYICIAIYVQFYSLFTVSWYMHGTLHVSQHLPLTGPFNIKICSLLNIVINPFFNKSALFFLCQTEWWRCTVEVTHYLSRSNVKLLRDSKAPLLILRLFPLPPAVPYFRFWFVTSHFQAAWSLCSKQLSCLTMYPPTAGTISL